MEEPHSGEGHHDAVFVAALDDGVVPDRSARLGYIANAAAVGSLDVVREGKEGVGSERHAGTGGEEGLLIGVIVWLLAFRKGDDANPGQDMTVQDPVTNEKFIPYCIEPSLGADRVTLAFLAEAYDEQKIVNAKGESEVDGLKTGYAEYCGSSIILTGKRDGRRAIVIVVGSETSKMRDEHARRLMVNALNEVSRPR